jgi:hypothetical protein
MSTSAPYQVMPPLSPEDRAALKADIASRGVQVPVEYDELGNVLEAPSRRAARGILTVEPSPPMRLVSIVGIPDTKKEAGQT